MVRSQGVPASGGIFPRSPWGYLAPRPARQPAQDPNPGPESAARPRTFAATASSSDEPTARSLDSEAEVAAVSSVSAAAATAGSPAGEQHTSRARTAVDESETDANTDADADVETQEEMAQSAEQPVQQPHADAESAATSASESRAQSARDPQLPTISSPSSLKPKQSQAATARVLGRGRPLPLDDGVARRVLNSMRTPDQKNLRQETAPSSQVVERILQERFRKEHANTPDAA